MSSHTTSSFNFTVPSSLSGYISPGTTLIPHYPCRHAFDLNPEEICGTSSFSYVFASHLVMWFCVSILHPVVMC